MQVLESEAPDLAIREEVLPQCILLRQVLEEAPSEVHSGQVAHISEGAGVSRLARGKQPQEQEVSRTFCCDWWLLSKGDQAGLSLAEIASAWKRCSVWAQAPGIRLSNSRQTTSAPALSLEIQGRPEWADTSVSRDCSRHGVPSQRW